ncbi:hypothetical protein E2C01_026567 [Portunus trituberculatus]|uniref:Uncharacterized protein n=1 Tax=Portunus trituberculatus TaxID=210409 RepID=A0A5B7EJI7_PORTR|nr:hypothetical protein [Portunus trituberculatus]
MTKYLLKLCCVARQRRCSSAVSSQQLSVSREQPAMLLSAGIAVLSGHHSCCLDTFRHQTCLTAAVLLICLPLCLAADSFLPRVSALTDAQSCLFAFLSTLKTHKSIMFPHGSIWLGKQVATGVTLHFIVHSNLCYHA